MTNFRMTNDELSFLRHSSFVFVIWCSLLPAPAPCSWLNSNAPRADCVYTSSANVRTWKKSVTEISALATIATHRAATAIAATERGNVTCHTTCAGDAQSGGIFLELGFHGRKPAANEQHNPRHGCQSVDPDGGPPAGEPRLVGEVRIVGERVPALDAEAGVPRPGDQKQGHEQHGRQQHGGKPSPRHVGFEDGHGGERTERQGHQTRPADQPRRIEPQPANSRVDEPQCGEGDQSQAG